MYDAASAANGLQMLQALGLDYSNSAKDSIEGMIDGVNLALDSGSALNGWTAELKIMADNLGFVDSNGKIRKDLTDDDYKNLAIQMLNGTSGVSDSGLKNWANQWLNRGQKLDASDAKITLDGVEYSSSKNTFEINGLTLTVNATTDPNETITITTEDDTDGIYDMIKNFFKEYNSLINQMDKLYNADSSKGYEPLLDEEKEAMSESEIEEWETKIKDSILRKDSSLNTIASEMKRIMMEGVNMAEEGEPKKMMYLSQFGINTLGYFIAAENEKNAYHIDGDSDDADTSGNADKLKSMIANDPDTVVKFFTTLSRTLYDRMTEVMAGTKYSSAYTAYDKWYAKFAAMETAMAKMQQNASAVTALLGGGM